MLVNVLDRIFDGHDMTAGLLVAIADHGGQGCGFAGAGAADDDHEAALRQHHFLQDRGQLEFLEAGDLGIDHADDAAHRPLLHEGADAKAPDTRGCDREVTFLRGVELLGLPIVHDRPDHGGRLFGSQGPLALRADLTVKLDGGRKPRRDEQVRGFLLGHAPQQVLHELDSLVAIHDGYALYEALSQGVRRKRNLITTRLYSAPCSELLPC